VSDAHEEKRALAAQLHHEFCLAHGTKEPPGWHSIEQAARDAWINVAELAIIEIRRVPIPMRLVCEKCGTLHVDEGRFAMDAHRDHACQICGAVWRPALVPTVGVRFLPGYKNEGSAT
jgi:hypothetical protein